MTGHRQACCFTHEGSGAIGHSRSPGRAIPIPGRPSTRSNPLRKALTRSLMGMVRLYQLTLSPFIGGQCRFHPTCSSYAIAVLERQGPLKGSWLALKRLLKCHPFHPGGFDPPPGEA